MSDSSDDDAAEVMSTVFSARPGESLYARTTSAVLEVIEGADRGTLFDIDLRGRRHITCGRGHGNQVRLTDASVSNAHFELLLGDERIEIRDMGSRNGVWVGGVALERASLVDGAEFSAGRCKFRFRLEQVAEVAISTSEQCGAMLGRSTVMRELFALLVRMAKSRLTVLVQGETGTGKELAARAIHEASPRARGPYVVLDCGAIPKELAESTLFGHRRGAFTGAVADHTGVFVQANGGTLFLDEIGELAPELQAKLLRALESREVTPVGSSKPVAIDVRLVAASHRDLRKMVANDQFRLDLHTRLSVFELVMPPLRERRADIPLLARVFVSRIAAELGRELTLADDAVEVLQQPQWEGNVRQLQNVIARSAHLADGSVITARDLVDVPGVPSKTATSDGMLGQSLKQLVDDLEQRYCRQVLAHFDGNVALASKHSGYSRKGFENMLARLGLERGGAADV